METDVIQLILWVVLGLFITWGIFLAYVGFRHVPTYKTSRVARSLANLAFIIGVFFIMLWVSAVVFNTFQIVGFI